MHPEVYGVKVQVVKYPRFLEGDFAPMLCMWLLKGDFTAQQLNDWSAAVGTPNRVPINAYIYGRICKQSLFWFLNICDGEFMVNKTTYDRWRARLAQNDCQQ